MTEQFFKVENIDGVIHAIFKREEPEMNCLSEPVIRELDAIVAKVEGDSAAKGFVISSGREGQFIVGADISEFARFKTAEEAEEGAKFLADVFTRISNLKVPSVAAINGQCLGGGLELALACTWRIVADNDKTALALPEIQLGLIPGAGGTQRLPKRVGIQIALDMILTGKRIRPVKALKIGLADEVVPENVVTKTAMKYATRPRRDKGITEHLAPTAIANDLPRWATDGNPIGRGIMRKKAKEMVDEKTKGFYPASYKALDSVFDGYDEKIESGLKREQKLFGQLAMTKESKSLVHLFHSTNKIKKHAYLGADKEIFDGAEAEKIGVVGAGLMGMGIATVASDKGMHVSVSDPSKDAMGRGLRAAKSFYDKKLKRKRLKPFEVETRMLNIAPTLKPVGFSSCDVVIEAVFEDLGLKQKILAELESEAPEHWIFATNTSAIPIKDIAANSQNKERVLGMHFFSPVEKMPLLEVVTTDETAPWAAARAVALGQRMGKQVIVVKDSPGFYTTRALAFYLNEAAHILEEGAKIEMIDRALTDFGFPVGPITLIDEVGVDVGAHVLETIAKNFGDRIEVPKAMQAIQDSGRLGRKNERGFYRYSEGKKTGPDPDIYSLFESKDADAPTAAEIVDRCLLLFVNESAKCLEEGVLHSAYDGDVGAVFGLGFPPFWGGPFKYCDQAGAKSIVERLDGLKDKFGQRFEPAAILKKHAENETLFFPDE